MYLVKAGESHGKEILGILCNVPAGIKISENFINSIIKDRSLCLGRSSRQLAEDDKLDFISGLRNGITLGNNMAFAVKNRANSEFLKIMDEFDGDEGQRKVTAVRPGHGDLPGILRFNFNDGRNVLEGASARNTISDVVAGGIAISMLNMLGIKVGAIVRSFGKVKDDNFYSTEDILNSERPAFSPDVNFVEKCKNQLEIAENKGESLGGTIEILVTGIKAGFGSYVSEKRLDSMISKNIMSVQAVKGLYFGKNPFDFCGYGSQYQGSITRENNQYKVNNSSNGGICGGMTDGGNINITVGIKPIPTTKKGCETVDILSGEKVTSAKERSDTTAVFALTSIVKSQVALAISEAVTERLGCDNMENIIKRYNLL